MTPQSAPGHPFNLDRLEHLNRQHDNGLGRYKRSAGRVRFAVAINTFAARRKERNEKEAFQF